MGYKGPYKGGLQGGATRGGCKEVVEQLDRARRIELEAMRKRIFSYGCNFSVMSVTYTRTNTSTR